MILQGQWHYQFLIKWQIRSFDKDKVVLVPDHFTPNKDIKSAENSKAILDFTNNNV